MRIAIDIRPLLEPHRAGVSLYTLNLLWHLAARKAHDYALFCNSSRLPLPEDVPPGTEKFFTRWPNRGLNACFALLGRPRLERLTGGADLVWLPNLNFAAADVPLVVTVHDLSFVRYPEFFSFKQRAWHRAVRVERMLRRAESVVAVSNHTKEDVCELFGTDEDKVAVVPPAAGQEFVRRGADEVAAVRAKYGLPERFVLYLGTLEPRKNVTGLIRAFDAAETGDTELVLAGGRGWLYRRIFHAAAESAKRDRIRFLGYVDEADKPALYSAATVFAYPSFYEGFGMPALEALACGVPVLASHTSSLGEVVGNAGLLVNPSNGEEMALGLSELLGDARLRAELAAAGPKRAYLFSWDRSAARLERAFEG
ncbi:glycosyltransferase family 4 protein [Patescibacteria group bacterium]